ncbi:MAG: hypothetical protein MZV49_24065 [Rhodopseudomonas palustris]|nr:hypothetical protein [Rhodopseudomonas palustris]
MKAGLWLPWKYKIGDKEVRLSSEDVYDALDKARMSRQYIIEDQEPRRRVQAGRGKEHRHPACHREWAPVDVRTGAQGHAEELQIPGGKT